MKLFRKIRKTLLTFCAGIAVLCGTVAIAPAFQFDKATAEGTIASNVFQTDGASVRVFQTTKDDQGKDVYGETDKKGIRFHVEMGAGYVYGGKEIVNTTAEKYNRGSYKLTDGFKTYTLVLPTRLLSGDLTVDTEKVMKIDTTEYWFSDKDYNYESVAYVYNIPEKWYTDNFSYRGVICTVAEDGTETVVSQTEVAERNLAWVAKQAYNDTIIGGDNHYWGTAEKDEAAAPLIKQFIPTYSITYKVNGAETKEEVLWGDAPQNAPTEGVKGAWYDTNNSEEVKVGKEIPMNWAEDRTLTLETTTSEEFILSGVAAKTDFEVNSTTYKGVKVYATLHREAFANKTQMDIKAVNIEHIRGGEVLEDGIELQGVWTLEEQNTLGEWQMLLFFAFDSSSMENGDELIIKGDSIFYAKNVMYKLTEDYTIDYTKAEAVEDYGMYLGDLYNSDVFMITNCSEDSSGNEGEPNEFTVRVVFYEDVMINGEFTFEFGPDSDTTKYLYPVYIQCGEDKNKLIPISGGRYYWNEGQEKILELIGAGEYENKVFGWHNGDKLYGAPGTIVKQNGGYYIFKDEMYAYFLANGNVDKWGYALGDWVVGTQKAEYTTSEFAAEGSVTETTDYGALADEIRINTTNHWFGQAKVNLLTTEKMLASAPYAVYCTSKDGTVTEIDKVRYHGQANPEGGNYQILGLCGEGKFAVGDVVTIAEGTRFWLGTEYYTVTEEITYYYNGNFWVQNYDESTMGTLSSASFGDRAHNQGATELRMYFTAPVAGYTTTDGGAFDELRIGTGSITFNGKPVSYVRYQRWDANSTWLSFGGYSGSVAFGDKVVIEAGTTIWGANKVAYKFTEKVEWIYAANPDANRTWSRVRGGVTVSATADNATVSGAGTFAVGETYTLNVAPTGDYLIFAVIVNNKELPLNASNTYTFTVEQSNTIKVQTVVGHKVYFRIPEGATVNGGAIADGGFDAVADSGSYTFSVAVDEGYKLSVAGATNNGDGTYTVSNVTADTTVTVSVEKLYKVTYSGENANFESNVSNGAWADNGTIVNITITPNDGYVVTAVTGATKTGENTYTATVSGADLAITVTTLEKSSFTDITDTISVENWGGEQDGEDNKWFVIKPSTLDEYMIPVSEMQPIDKDSSIYWNDHLENTDHNYGVDLMDYICIDGVSIRTLINQNASNNQYTGTTFPFSEGGVYAPVTLEMDVAAGLWMRVMTAFDTEYEITIKAGFTFACVDAIFYVSKDVTFVFNGSTVGNKYSTATITETNSESVTITGDLSFGANTVEFGTTYTFTPTANDGYQITSVEGATANGDGSYSFTANGTDVSIVVTAKKLYAVTWSNPTGATITVTANGNAISSGATVVEGTSISVTATASSGYAVTNVTANGTSIGTTSGTYTVNGATTIAATAKKLYAVTWSNPTGATISVTANGSAISSGVTVVEGTSISVSIQAKDDYRLDTVSGLGDVSANISKERNGKSEFTYTVNAATSISATTVKMYTVSWSAGDKTSITCNTNGLSNGGWVDNGTTVTFTIKSTDSNYNLNVSGATNTSGDTYSVTVNGANVNVEATATYSGGCLVEGTMITLADGTQKAVEDLQVGNMVLAFNHYTGELDVAPVALNAHAEIPAQLYRVLNLQFSNGVQLRTVAHHGFYDVTTCEYIMLSESNVNVYIGHEFYYTQDGIHSEIITLTGYYVTEEIVKIFSPVTMEYANYFAAGILNATSIPDTNTSGHLNYFEINQDMKYDAGQMEADIEAYGLYTYEEFAEYMPQEVFDMWCMQYFKISVGKGLITEEEIIALCEYIKALSM